VMASSILNSQLPAFFSFRGLVATIVLLIGWPLLIAVEAACPGWRGASSKLLSEALVPHASYYR
jgi:hypothetical protein